MVMRRCGGYTLMEMIMVVGIISILFGVSAPILLQANRQFIMVRTKIELQQEARGIMYVLTRALRQGQKDTITISRANNSQPFYSKITFTRAGGTTTLISPTLVFQQEGNTLYQLFDADKRVLTHNLEYLGFTFPRSDDMSILSVSITLRKNIYEGRTKALHMASEKVRVMN